MKKSLKKLVKGGVESIILIVVLVAIVIGLITVAVIPMAGEVENVSDAGVGKLSNIWNP